MTVYVTAEELRALREFIEDAENCGEVRIGDMRIYFDANDQRPYRMDFEENSTAFASELMLLPFDGSLELHLLDENMNFLLIRMLVISGGGDAYCPKCGYILTSMEEWSTPFECKCGFVMEGDEE
jgi:hypothetical protein